MKEGRKGKQKGQKIKKPIAKGINGIPNFLDHLWILVESALINLF
jgi:hypothetical protein